MFHRHDPDRFATLKADALRIPKVVRHFNSIISEEPGSMDIMLVWAHHIFPQVNALHQLLPLMNPNGNLFFYFNPILIFFKEL